jgi:hypothetical protein
MELETNTNDITTSSTEGVVLFAFGKIGYYQAAYNLAYSIKYHSPNVKIALYVDDIGKCYGSTGDINKYVDSINQIEHSDLYVDGKFDPAMLKVSLYKYLPFKYNLYLDVDAVCLKDIQPLLDDLVSTKRHYISHCVGYHTIDLGRDIPSMQWAWADDIWEHFKLTTDSILPAINSSLQFIKVCKESKDLFGVVRILYTTNQLPTKRLRMKWGNGQPDELYMNVALAMTAYDPSYKNDGLVGGNNKSETGFIHFASVRGLSFQEVTDNFYFQSYYGGRNFTSRFYTEWLERLLKVMMKSEKKVHQFHIDRIIGQKYVNK